MEEVLNMKRAAAGKRFALAAERAADLSAKHPQLGDSTELEPQDPHGMPHGGNKENTAGLKRVIGRGRGKRAAAAAAAAPAEDPAALGAMLADHLRKTRGGAFMRGFQSGMACARSRSSSPEGPPAPAPRVRGGARPAASGKRISDPAGIEVSHAVPEAGPPNSVPAQAYGSPPQAPAAFKRNTVGMGKPSKAAAAARLKEPMNGGAMLPVGSGSPAADKRRARGAMVSKLMKQHGMTLGEASRHIKEHGGV